MKYNIFINQKAAWEMLGAQVDLVDLALLDYLRDICAVPSPKLERKVFDGKEYVWVNYAHILNEMPYLGFKDRRGVANRIKHLAELGLIEKVTSNPIPGTNENRKTYVRLTEKAGRLFFSQDEGVSIQMDTVSIQMDTGVHTDGQIININDHKHQDHISSPYCKSLVGGNSNSRASDDDDDDDSANASDDNYIDRVWGYFGEKTGRIPYAPLEMTFLVKLKEQGIPPEVVMRGIDLALERFKRTGRQGRVKLTDCDEFIMSAWEEARAKGSDDSSGEVPPTQPRPRSREEFVKMLLEAGFKEEELGGA